MPWLYGSYDLVGTLAPSYVIDHAYQGIPQTRPLEAVGGAPSYVTDPGIAAPVKTVARLGAGQGLTVPGRPGMTEFQTYAIAISFRLDAVDPAPAAGTIAPLLSFDAGASGTGLVVRDGVVGWWNAGAASFTPVGGPITDRAWQTVVVQRTADGAVRLDRSGASAVVSAADAVPSTFQAGVQLFGPGSGAAELARVRWWAGLLTPKQLAEVVSTVADTRPPADAAYRDVPAVDPGLTWIGPDFSVGHDFIDDGTAPLLVRWSLHAGACSGPVVVTGEAGELAEPGRDEPAEDGVRTRYWNARSVALVDGADYAICQTATDRRGNALETSHVARADTVPPAVSVDVVPGADGTVAFAGSAGNAPRDYPTVRLTVYRGTAIPVGDDWQTRRVGFKDTHEAGGRWNVAALEKGDVTGAKLPDGDYIAEAEQHDKVWNTGLAYRTFRVGAGRIVPGPPVAPQPAKAVPGQQPADELLASAVSVLRKGGAAGLLRVRSLSARSLVPGRLQVVVFKGRAPKKPVTYSTLKRRASKLPANLVSLGAVTFAKPGRRTLKVVPSSRAKRLVGRSKRVTVTVRTTFVPRNGARTTRDRVLTLSRR